MNGLLIVGFGLVGLLLGGWGLIRTAISEAATLRGGRKIAREREPGLYWCNVAALCMLILISVGLVILGATTARL
jgi:hypothetical protein